MLSIVERGHEEEPSSACGAECQSGEMLAVGQLDGLQGSLLASKWGTEGDNEGCREAWPDTVSICVSLCALCAFVCTKTSMVCDARSTYALYRPSEPRRSSSSIAHSTAPSLTTKRCRVARVETVPFCPGTRENKVGHLDTWTKGQSAEP